MKTVLVLIIIIITAAPGTAQHDPLLLYPCELTWHDTLAAFNNIPFTGILIDETTKKPWGEFRSGLKHGIHRQYFPNGKISTEGTYTGGIKTGIHKSWFANGTLQASYNYTGGAVADGTYTIFRPDGTIEKQEIYKQGELASTLINGKTVLPLTVQYYHNGQKKSEGVLRKGLREGEWTDWFESGELEFQGTYINGMRSGWGKYYNRSENHIYEGEWLNGQPHGRGTTSAFNGTLIYEGLWKNGTPHGYGISYNNGSVEYSGTWTSGKKNGTGTLTFTAPNGSLVHCTGEFVNDNFTSGTYKETQRDGTVWQFTGELKNWKLYNGTQHIQYFSGKTLTRRYQNGTEQTSQ